MLTAKIEEIDKVVELEIGADDYITKPFSRLVRRDFQTTSAYLKIGLANLEMEYT